MPYKPDTPGAGWVFAGALLAALAFAAIFAIPALLAFVGL